VENLGWEPAVDLNIRRNHPVYRYFIFHTFKKQLKCYGPHKYRFARRCEPRNRVCPVRMKCNYYGRVAGLIPFLNRMQDHAQDGC